MKLAIVGSRNLTVEDLGAFLPEGITEFVSGGARGVDACARIYAQAHGIPIKEFLPDYPRYGRGAIERSLPMQMRCSPFGMDSRTGQNIQSSFAGRRKNRSR